MSANPSVIQRSYPTLVKTSTFDLSISRNVSLRLYSSNEPRNLKIADLQKGLILVFNGVQTVGEGVGFGVPALIYGDETYFSGSSEIYVSQGSNHFVVMKKFRMDRIARNSLNNIALENHAARGLIEHLSVMYQKHRRLRLLILKDLTGRMKIRKIFPHAPSRGIVTVTYEISKCQVSVKADFEDVKKIGLRQVFMLNEQGSKFFRVYTDSLGAVLKDEEIGAWDNVKGEWACLLESKSQFGFRLWKTGGSILRRGREFLEGSLDWVGLDYEMAARVKFEYKIDLLGVT